MAENIGDTMGAYYDQNLLSDITQRINILDVVADTVKLTRKGNRYWGLCPFHAEKTPSFSVTPEKNMFYCFGCHTGGNIFTYVMKRDGLDFPEAVQVLADRAGIQLKKGRCVKSRPFQKSGRGQQSRCSLVPGVLKVISAAKARQYLREESSEQTLERFQIGCPNQWNQISDFLLPGELTRNG